MKRNNVAEFTKMSSEARRNVLERFNPDKIYQDLEKMFLEIINQ